MWKILGHHLTNHSTGLMFSRPSQREKALNPKSGVSAYEFPPTVTIKISRAAVTGVTVNFGVCSAALE
jgi:hypothetical protein